MARDPIADDLTAIRNIGPALAATLKSAGIERASDLRKLGAHEAYRRVLRTGVRPHFITYHVIAMSLQGRPWNDCKGAEKKALRVLFDSLKAEEASPSRIAEVERFLDCIGTGLSR